MPPKPKRKSLSLQQAAKHYKKTHKPVEVVSPFADRGISRYTNYEVGGQSIYKPMKPMAQTFGSQKKVKGGLRGTTKYK